MIGIIEKPIQALLHEDIASNEIRWMPRPKTGEYLADPFAYWNDGALQVYYEQYGYDNRKGRIVKREFRNGKWDHNSQTILEDQYHISYPYLIEYQGAIYCIPETAENDQVDLYQYDENSKKLQYVDTLLKNTGALDPTIFQHNGYWWLFCTLKDNTNSALHVYYSENISGPYSAHHNNPVKEDIKSCRSAGTPFYSDGSLYRPAQDCSQTYGKKITINKINKLTPDEFEETVEKTIEPISGSEFNLGIHTLSAAGDYTLIDAKRTAFVWDNFTFQLSRKINKLLGNS